MLLFLQSFYDLLFSVRRAKGLNIKGKNGKSETGLWLRMRCASVYILGTNDAFVTIGLGKEKFQTSVKEKSENPEWLEQCELWVDVIVFIMLMTWRIQNKAIMIMSIIYKNHYFTKHFVPGKFLSMGTGPRLPSRFFIEVILEVTSSSAM